MRHDVLHPVLIAITIAAFVQSGQAKRAEINSLSECVSKADIIVMGMVESRTDAGDTGLLKITVLGVPLKGKVEARSVTVADAFFRLDHVPTAEGEITPEVKREYFFFLKAGAAGEYRLFNSYDGIIPLSVPVAREIENRVGKKK